MKGRNGQDLNITDIMRKIQEDFNAMEKDDESISLIVKFYPPKVRKYTNSFCWYYITKGNFSSLNSIRMITIFLFPDW